jgi:hypothetical protein
MRACFYAGFGIAASLLRIRLFWTTIITSGKGFETWLKKDYGLRTYIMLVLTYLNQAFQTAAIIISGEGFTSTQSCRLPINHNNSQITPFKLPSTFESL